MKLNRWTLGLAALGLVSLATVAQADTITNAPATTNAPPAPPPYGKKAKNAFVRRLNEAFMEQAAVPAYSPPDTNAPPSPVRRIGNPPFDSPPYPTQEWQLGGGPNILGDPGALRDAPYPLMQAIYDGPNGKWWYDNRIQFYGWVTVSGNWSTSGNNSGSSTSTPNFPEVYGERSRRIENDQDVLYIERMADKNQVDHIDWGFRIALLYGLDYRFMASRGYLNDQKLFGENRFQGFDTPMMYFNLYVPYVLDGMDILIGRIISEPDIEQQLAPNNLMASHSLVYAFDDYTTWGIFTTTKINKNWLVQLNLMDGVDIAPWESNDPGCQATVGLNIQYIADNGKDSFYVGCNSINSGQFGFNNLQEFIESYTHKFNETYWTTFEGQYMYTKDAKTAPTVTVPIEDGFFPVKNGYVWAGGIVNYTCARVAGNAFLTLRNEFWDDPQGYRSGYASPYYETAFGMTWWLDKLIVLRPEIRFEHALKHGGLSSTSSAINPTGGTAPAAVNGPYDNGFKQSQLTLACDLTFHF